MCCGSDTVSSPFLGFTLRGAFAQWIVPSNNKAYRFAIEKTVGFLLLARNARKGRVTKRVRSLVYIATAIRGQHIYHETVRGIFKTKAMDRVSLAIDIR